MRAQRFGSMFIAVTITATHRHSDPDNHHYHTTPSPIHQFHFLRTGDHRTPLPLDHHNIASPLHAIATGHFTTVTSTPPPPRASHLHIHCFSNFTLLPPHSDAPSGALFSLLFHSGGGNPPTRTAPPTTASSPPFPPPRHCHHCHHCHYHLHCFTERPHARSRFPLLHTPSFAAGAQPVRQLPHCYHALRLPADGCVSVRSIVLVSVSIIISALYMYCSSFCLCSLLLCVASARSPLPTASAAHVQSRVHPLAIVASCVARSLSL